MENNALHARHDALFSVLIYCSWQTEIGKAPFFTTAERICINQERGALLSQLNPETPPGQIRHYQCPSKLEAKILFHLRKGSRQ